VKKWEPGIYLMETHPHTDSWAILKTGRVNGHAEIIVKGTRYSPDYVHVMTSITLPDFVYKEISEEEMLIYKMTQ
jgi:hypothetical protein